MRRTQPFLECHRRRHHVRPRFNITAVFVEKTWRYTRRLNIQISQKRVLLYKLAARGDLIAH